ncbi:unnamed protein product [Effrenium voratum]|uniref:PARP catalytic domain-containing protein n=1 Tax=Effrenium voratum TaxID=2562239 RepID=A0AA36NE09_9DINO|nr:unnamed protein product [Effrenium voratum]CAJ1446711.1 unnamed protein product [Effrenium voratum]
MTCPRNHPLANLGTSKDNGWGCDGMKAPGGCRSGLTGFKQSYGMCRFQCKTCDFDFCEECYLEQLNSRRCAKGHPLLALGTSMDNGWLCDSGDGCKSKARGFKSTKGLPRFRCEACDFDYCERCYASPNPKNCDKGHPLTALGVTRDNGWGCDGRSAPGGCQRAMTGFKQSKGVPRYRCEVCDFDLCDKCYDVREVIDAKPKMRMELKMESMKVDKTLIPRHWDETIMGDIHMEKGLSPTADNVMNRFGKIQLSEKEVTAIQQIFDDTYKKVYTRDRKGSKVPDRLEVVRAERIQNLQNWAEFRLKQQEILEELVQLKEREQLGACSNGHALIPLGTTQDNGWACDARNEGEGGCLSGITGFHQTKGKNRFRCEKCDFDYCDKCYLLRTGAKLCMKGHPLVPLGTTQDNGWGCDNASTKAGCLRQNKTKGVDRHRCEVCDYDLCDLCYKKHIGHVINNLRTAGTSIMDLNSGDADGDTNTVWLFHGTSDEAAEKITRGDFLVDKAGSNAGTLYGRGIYLAESCSKSDEYSTENSDGHRCILLCRAALGNVLYNDDVAPNVDCIVRQIHDKNYHSLLGDREKCRKTFREFVVYDDDQVYPEFAVWYKRVYDAK